LIDLHRSARRLYRRFSLRKSARRKQFTSIAASLLFATALSGCHSSRRPTGAWIEFTRVPHAGEGGPDRLETIEGRVLGSRSGERIVLFARWGPWWVQPLVDQPFTEIQSDSTWRNATHLGTEYAALLVDSSYRPPATMGALPREGDGVIAAAATRGAPPYWLTWWFLLITVAAVALVILTLFRLRVLALTRQMNMLFEERLAERTRIARELHDSLLQGFHGLMFRLQAARDLLPARPAEAIQALEIALDRGDRVIAEGRNTVEDLRTSGIVNNDIVQALTALGEELSPAKSSHTSPLRVAVEGKRRDLDPLLRDEIYRIAREALRNAFRHSQARTIEVEISYGDSQFLLRVRDDGTGIDPNLFRQGKRDGHWGLPGMRERAVQFGGRVEVSTESGVGTEVELSVPASVAYRDSSAPAGFWPLRREAGGNS
jgi:signal transduction histidine kinase